MARTSRFPGFYKVTVQERRALVGDATGCDPLDIERALEGGGIEAETADKFVENVLGHVRRCRTASRSTCASTATTTWSPWSSRSRASSPPRPTPPRWCARAAASPPRPIRRIMISQIQITRRRRCRGRGAARSCRSKDEILALANGAVGGLVARGGGARDVEARVLGDDDR